MSHPLVPIDASTVRRAHVTGVPGGAVIWNFIVDVVSPPVDSKATHSIPVVGSVEKTHAVHEKNATRAIEPAIHAVRTGLLDEP